MASFDLPSAEALQRLVAGLSDAAKQYNPAAGPAGIETNFKIVAQAEEIARQLTDASFVGHVYVSRVSLSMY